MRIKGSDGAVNAADIVEAVNDTMDNPSNNFNTPFTDLNGDDAVNGAGIVLIVNKILCRPSKP